MQANCSDASIGSITASPREIDQDRPATLAYQLATILAILLFLISF